MVERVSDLFVEVCREDGDGLVVAQADGGESGEIDCRGHDETVGIIGMLADYVDPARCGECDGLQPKPLQVKGPVSATSSMGASRMEIVADANKTYDTTVVTIRIHQKSH